MTKDQMIKELRKDICEIVFVKKDGTNRTMNATLQMEVVPEDKRPKGTGKELPDDSPMLRAFDVDLKEFRTINTETVNHFGAWRGTVFKDIFPEFA